MILNKEKNQPPYVSDDFQIGPNGAYEHNETIQQMNNLDKQYQDLLQDILDNGVTKSDRTGTGIISIFGRQIRHKMSDGFPLLTTKKMPFKTIVTELLWFLRGDTNIKYLVDNDCHIWDGDAYKNYCNQIPEYSKQFTMSKEEYISKIKTDNEFAKKWGELGPIYGKQWRNWNGRKTDGFIEYENNGYNEHIKGIDQIVILINDLKTNPDSRRLMVNAWNVGELDQMVLPPCHYGFQVYTRELTARERTALGSNGSTRLYDSIKEENYTTIDADDVMHTVCDDRGVPRRAISLMWNQRSVDTFLGLPFNIASYGLLLMMIADEVNMVPDELIGNLGDTHLYSNHIDQAKEQIGRDPFELPTLRIKQHSNDEPSAVIKPQYWHPEDFVIENYQSHPSIKAPLSN